MEEGAESAGALPVLSVVNTMLMRKREVRAGQMAVLRRDTCGMPYPAFIRFNTHLPMLQAQGRDVVLEVGRVVLGRVLRLTSKQAHVEVLAVGEQALRQACQGIIKKEDVRQHDVC